MPGVLRELSRRPLERATILRYIACDRRQDLHPHLSRITAPVLVVAGEEDALTGPDRAQAVVSALPAAALEIIPDCGHTPQIERAPALARLVVPFLVQA